MHPSTTGRLSPQPFRDGSLVSSDSQHQQHPQRPRLFVSGVKFVSKQTLINLFKTYPGFAGLTLHEEKGIAFVNFEFESVLEQVIVGTNAIKVDNRVIYVQRSLPKGQVQTTTTKELCFHCNQCGHKARECPQRKSGRPQSVRHNQHYKSHDPYTRTYARDYEQPERFYKGLMDPHYASSSSSHPRSQYPRCSSSYYHSEYQTHPIYAQSSYAPYYPPEPRYPSYSSYLYQSSSTIQQPHTSTSTATATVTHEAASIALASLSKLSNLLSNLQYSTSSRVS